MAMTQRRWLCETCEREWVFARNWQESDGCPGCRSSLIREIEYQALFPGADVPRGGAHAVKAVPMSVETAPVSLALVPPVAAAVPFDGGYL